MTVKELKEILAELPDNLEVCYEYDGPDSHTEVYAADYVIYEDRIILVEKVLGQ